MRWSGQLRDACARMLPRLQAEEDIRLANAVALGSGSLKKDDAKKLSAALNKAAQAKRTVIRPSSEAERAGMLASIGFGVPTSG